MTRNDTERITIFLTPGLCPDIVTFLQPYPPLKLSLQYTQELPEILQPVITIKDNTNKTKFIF